MKHENITRVVIENDELSTREEEELGRLAVSQTEIVYDDDSPPLLDHVRMRRKYPGELSIRLDAETLRFFSSQGGDFRETIAQVLKNHARKSVADIR